MISSSGYQLLVTMVVFTVIVTAVVALRFWAAKLKKRSIRIDDWLIVLAWVSTMCDEATTFWAIPNGLGEHQDLLTANEIGIQYQNLTAISVTWLTATVAIKASILWFYSVIFTTPKFRIAVYVMQGVCFGYFVTFMAIFMTQCTPLSQPWNPVPGGTCRDLHIEELSSVALNMLIDIIIVILPLPTLWKLQMGIQNKLLITFMISMGLIVTAIMAWRLQITLVPSTLGDVTFGLGDVCLVSSLELWIGIIAACVPTLAPVYITYISPVLSSFRSSRKSDGPSNLREAKLTIGGSSGKRSWGRGKSRLDTERYLELEEGRYLSRAEVRRGSDSTANHTMDWTKHPNDIEIRHEVSVSGTPKRELF